MLLCNGRRFTQLFEGSAARLDASMVRTRRDPRHRNLSMLRERGASARDFGDWGLSCRALGFDEAYQSRFVADVRADVARLADAASKAVFIGLATIGRR